MFRFDLITIDVLMNRVLWIIPFIVFILTCSTNRSIVAQNPSYRLTVESGGYVDFKINTLNRYQGGLSYSNWTRLKIVYDDTRTGTQTDKWYLDFRANTTEFVGDIPGNTLPLDYVSIYVESIVPEDPTTDAVLYQGPHALDGTFTRIVDNGDEGVFRLNLTYNLDSAAIGNPDGYYNTELIFKMDTIP